MLPMIPFIPLKVLGKLGKGLATVVGLGGVAATTTALEVPSFDLNEALRQILEIIRALSGLLAFFGLGRKAGVAASE